MSYILEYLDSNHISQLFEKLFSFSSFVTSSTITRGRRETPLKNSATYLRLLWQYKQIRKMFACLSQNAVQNINIYVAVMCLTTVKQPQIVVTFVACAQFCCVQHENYKFLSSSCFRSLSYGGSTGTRRSGRTELTHTYTNWKPFAPFVYRRRQNSNNQI